MIFILTILKILEILLIAFLGIASAYIFVFALAGLFYRKRIQSNKAAMKKIALFIPGYKEDAVILDVAKSALQQDYPSDLFEVIVIADSFLPMTIAGLKELPVQLIEVSFENSTKSKSLNKAMEVIHEDYDIALVLDADNIVESNFLLKINDAFAKGAKVVQAHRVAKNLNTPFAILDAISEEVNNHIFRKGHRVLGLSAGLIGSGMAFEYNYFKQIMSQINAVGGFDKELELRILKDELIIEYLNDAYVFDEKIQRPSDFSNQRRRWLSAQMFYCKKYFLKGLKQVILNLNFDLFDKVYQLTTPPRILLLGIVSIITVGYAIIDFLIPSLEPGKFALYWYCIFGMTITAFFVAIPRHFYNAQALRAVLTIPKAFFTMFFLLFKLKGANKKFIHTKHGTIDN